MNVHDDSLSFQKLTACLKGNQDLYFRQEGIVGIALVDGIANKQHFADYVLHPLGKCSGFTEGDAEKLHRQITEGSLWYPAFCETQSFSELVTKLLRNGAALIVGNMAYVFDMKAFDRRAVSEPTGESLVKGAKDSFVENISTNTAILRQRIGSPDLRIESLQLGRRTSTTVCVIYLQGVVDPAHVKEVKTRLGKIDIAALLTTSPVEEALTFSPRTLFPQVLYTERPDVACARLCEGRVAVMINGLPTVLIVPVTLPTFLHSKEDMANNYIFNSCVRILRHFLVFVVLYAPSMYVALTTFHVEMMPTSFVAAIAASKSGVPLTIFLEALLLLLAFETLIEAGLRLPKTVGQLVSIVGALVVGEAAVTAKLLSPGVVIIVSLSVISNFTVPNQDFANALRLWRLILTVCAGLFGVLGVFSASLLLLTDLCSITPYGIPYCAPYAGASPVQLENSLLRARYSRVNYRPRFLTPLDIKQSPIPPDEEE
ncbi:MAG: spore germination protein [Clostridia bacterium]|nr:spore germination protein [Clostridia bacterium]